MGVAQHVGPQGEADLHVPPLSTNDPFVANLVEHLKPPHHFHGLPTDDSPLLWKNPFCRIFFPYCSTQTTDRSETIKRETTFIESQKKPTAEKEQQTLAEDDNFHSTGLSFAGISQRGVCPVPVPAIYVRRKGAREEEEEEEEPIAFDFSISIYEFPSIPVRSSTQHHLG
ncbi:hypothetical protein B296_00019417 [Ensete ventricosum]|uniref:Uncharacterized protein n=1 Tax=Ensete ventricosum TaxID=4639 RepID=A0A427AX81_ENSVE|nr:hypothetical protein B296_00019417 [Ensete ventricosum]